MGLTDITKSLEQGLDWALDAGKQISTVYDNLSWQYEPRSIDQGTPEVGYPEGRDEVHTENTIDKAADVIQMGTNFYEQVKGFFGLGYPATEAQPASPITHEYDPAKPPPPEPKPGGFKLTTDMKIVIGLAVLAYFVLR